MSVEANKTAFRSIPEQLFNTGDLRRKFDYFTEDFVEHAILPPGWPNTIEALEMWLGMMHTAFPDFKATVHNVIGEGDYVAGFLTVRGTHLGEFMGIPATGRQVTWDEHHFGRMVNGRCAEHWGLADLATLMQQLTAAPEGQTTATPAGQTAVA
jgi:predicted ester cyclase